VVQLVNTLAPILSSLEQVERYREALAARERRMETAFDQLRAEQQELRTAVTVLRQSNHDLTRELSTVRSGDSSDARRGEPLGSPAGTTTGTSSEALSAKYVGFEDQFRGAPEEIAARQREYVEIFAGASDVLDIGCGRGEFLALLKERGVQARGIDVNDSMVEVCLQKGLEASKADALGYLRAQPAGSLGGLLAAQVVEHLDPAYLTNLLDAAYAALRPGARSCSRPSTRRAGSRSSRATCATSRTCGRCTRHAEVPAAGERLRRRRDPLPGAVSGAPQAAACDGAGAGRFGRDAQRQRGQAELAAVYVSGLRSDRASLVDTPRPTGAGSEPCAGLSVSAGTNRAHRFPRDYRSLR
jgi:SAM-dependent methyltransferase